LLKKKYAATFAYTHTADIITDVILADTAKKGLYQTSANVNDANFLSLNLNAPVAIAQWWSSNNSFTLFNNQYKTPNLEGMSLAANKTSFYFSSNHNITISQTMNAEVSGHYRSATAYGSLLLGNEYSIDLGISKSFLDKKANIKFAVTDIFNTRRSAVESTLSNVNYHVYQKQDTRVARLTFSYRFGSSSIKEARQHTTGVESEQRRIRN